MAMKCVVNNEHRFSFSDVNPSAKKLTGKRTRNPETWHQNIRKKKREAGHEYTDNKGQKHAARSVKGKCDCRMKRFSKINDADQNVIHCSFWKLSDNEKSHFYGKFIQGFPKKRSRPRHLPTQKPEDCYRQYSYNYYFELSGDKAQLCKMFLKKNTEYQF